MGLILSHPCLPVNPVSHTPFWALTLQRDGFPRPAGCRQLGAALRTPRRGKESTVSSPDTPPVTHRSCNYHQVKQNAWGRERILNLLTSGRCNPQSQRDPSCEKLRIPRHFQWENPELREKHNGAAISWVSPLCVTMPCSQHRNQSRLKGSSQMLSTPGSLHQLAGSSLHPLLQQKYKF